MLPLHALLDGEVQAYVRKHENDDVAALALKTFPFDPALRAPILGQIKSRQKAQDKLPSWHEASGIVFPPGDLIEQCSSEATARYKAAISGAADLLVDLTGGCGVDAAALSKNFQKTICIEADADAAACLGHNMKIMADNAIVIHARAEDYIAAMPPADLVFIDPQRRTESRRGIYRLEDCQPHIVRLLPHLKGKTRRVLLKTSPMLDIDHALGLLPGVCDVHVVEWRRECKETLYMIDMENGRREPAIHAVTIGNSGQVLHRLSFTRPEEKVSAAPLSLPLRYIHEPGPALMKAGCFSLIAARFNLGKLHADTHLYTSADPVSGFPGRSFLLTEMLRADRKAVQKALPAGKAHLKIRNFPGSSSQDLQKKLGLEEGGDTQIFACTLIDESRALLLCRPVPAG